MPPPVAPDEISLMIEYKSEENENGVLITFPNIDVAISTPINPEQNVSYLKWKTEEDFSFFEFPCGPLHQPKGCFVHLETNPDDIVIFSGERLGQGYLQQQLVASKRIDDLSQFLFRHYFSVYQYAMTKKAYDFWEKIKLTSAPSGNIFDLPPATVRGNIYNIEDKDELVGGYFEASSVNVIRKYLTPSDMSPITFDQIYNYCNTGICCNCLIIFNATTEAPDFWE
ncbi:MAG: DUF4249 family protein [Cyclobacteriaceae bacterium]|nr:DUF4249 family protein [Cyclobacteriaceae bacterium]